MLKTRDVQLFNMRKEKEIEKMSSKKVKIRLDAIFSIGLYTTIFYAINLE